MKSNTSEESKELPFFSDIEQIINFVKLTGGNEESETIHGYMYRMLKTTSENGFILVNKTENSKLKEENQKLREEGAGNHKWQESKPLTIEPRELYEVTEDMSPDGRLQLMQEDDGDMIISIVMPEITYAMSIQFCTLQGGGRKPKVLRALRNLAQAIKETNEGNF